MVNVHVDDLLVVSNSEDAVAAIHCVLKDKYGQFTMKSNKSSYLGMEIESLADNSISIKQSGYLKSILDKCEYKSTHVTPSTADFFESVDDSTEDYTSNSATFKSLLMSLMFLATRTRPDILKEVVYLSSFALNPGPIASNKLNRIVGYLRYTADLGIRLNMMEPILSIYCDASFGTHNNGRSHSGIVITFGVNSGPVLVKSSIQKLVSTSSTEAEIICLVSGIKRVMPIYQLISELDVGFAEYIQVYEDNMSSIHLAKGAGKPRSQKRLFRVRYNFISELIQAGTLQLDHCPTDLMLADLCTKPIGGQAFRAKRDALLNASLV
jgi:hypothetical protein